MTSYNSGRDRCLATARESSVDRTGTSRHLSGWRVRAGETLYTEGDPGGEAFEVVSGAFKCYHTFFDGRRQIIDTFHEGDIFGAKSGDRRHSSVEALTDGLLVAIDQRALDADLAKAPAQVRRLNSALLRRLARLEARISQIGRLSAVARIAAYLLEESDRHGGNGRFDLEMCRQDIADQLGLTVETVSRTITRLRSEGAIDTPSPRRIVVTDKPALRALAAGDAD